mmetsp:Transcript_42628/g.117611  ORF Transcript_42628/g.117611 Transcript_42628/m.117611 type:complete len:209 (+) Transcript_42628:93-719(+)
MPVTGEAANFLNKEWKVGMCSAPCEAPLSCCFGSVCCCCAIMKQRNDILEVTGEPYVCCAGIMCGCLPDCPKVPCLCIESFLCPSFGLAANRFMMQTRFGLENTEWDDRIICCANALACLADVAQCCRILRDCGVDIPGGCDDCLADNADSLRDVAQCVILGVSGCMYAQQEIELDAIRDSGYAGPPRELVAALPPKQQSMIFDGKAI